MPGFTYKRVAVALQDRHLVTVSKKGGVWRATITGAGTYYLECRRHPDAVPPTAPERLRDRHGRPSAERALARAKALEAEAAAEEAAGRLGTGSAPGPVVAQALEISTDTGRNPPMRYRVIATRVQVTERFVRAADRDAAAKKIQAELDRPYGYMGEWRTIDSEMDVRETEEALLKAPGPLGEGGSLVLSVKDAAAYLGVSTSVMYELVKTGEIGHLPLGSRKMISRKAIEAFVEANTRHG